MTKIRGNDNYHISLMKEVKYHHSNKIMVITQ